MSNQQLNPQELEQLTTLYTMQFSSKVRQTVLEQEKAPSRFAEQEKARQLQLEEQAENYTCTNDFKRQIRFAAYRLSFYDLLQQGVASERARAAKHVLMEEQRAYALERIANISRN